MALREWYRAMKGSGLTGPGHPGCRRERRLVGAPGRGLRRDGAVSDVRDVSMTLVEHATGVPL